MTPKVELHLHLEGAAPPRFIRDLAKRRHIDIGGIFGQDGGYAFKRFPAFLKVYDAATSVLTTPEDYHALTLAVAEACAENGVVYAETFVAPDFCGGGDLGAWREHVHALTEAASQTERDMGLVLRGIVTAVRHLGPAQARKTALCAAETAGDFVVGFGLAGDEMRCEPKDFAWSFDLAREAGLGLTAHAGEWRGPDGIRDTLACLRPSRLGHGVRAIEDLALVDHLAEEGIVLEVCPGSNIALGIYPGWRAHPIGPLFERGVKVTVSTDDPPFFRTTMTAEHDRLAEAFDWDAGVFRTLAQTALAAAFCDAGTREAVAGRLKQAD